LSAQAFVYFKQLNRFAHQALRIFKLTLLQREAAELQARLGSRGCEIIQRLRANGRRCKDRRHCSAAQDSMRMPPGRGVSPEGCHK
jgi:hypothetical protein